MVEGGFLLRPRTEIKALIEALAARRITLKDARALLASFEMRAIRDASKASAGKGRGEAFTVSELSKLSGLSVKETNRARRRLFKGGYQLYSANGGSLPLPRRLVRFLAKTEKRSTFLTLLAYLERGMFLKNGRVTAAGTVKASTLSHTTKLSLRAVRMARQELLSLGILTADTTKSQRKLNRTGAYFTVNLDWTAPGKALARPHFAPPPPKKGGVFCTPNRDKKTYFVRRNQKTRPPSAGLFKNREQGKGGRVLAPPTLRDVKAADLESFSRTEELYRQAVRAGIAQPTEAAALNFLAAAVRAKELAQAGKVSSAPRTFVAIVRKQLYHHVTQANEDRALAALRRYRASDPDRFRVSM